MRTKIFVLLTLGLVTALSACNNPSDTNPAGTPESPAGSPAAPPETSPTPSPSPS